MSEIKINRVIDHRTMAVEFSLNTFLKIQSGAEIKITARKIHTKPTITNIMFLAVVPCL